MLNKDVAISMKEYGREKLQEMSEELMTEYVHNVVLLKLCKEATGSTPTDASYQEDVKLLLKQYGLNCVCFGTVCNWIKKLGFKYQVRKKAYYVDGCKRPATVDYRKKFVQQYLMYERRVHCWLQISLEESKELEKKG
jgi:hypothetical protein